MDWNVKNAISRDVERQHLNKILAEIKAAVANATIIAQKAIIDSPFDAIGSMVENNTETGLNVVYDRENQKLDFTVNSFSIELRGAVTGEATVRNLSSVVIQTEIDESLVGVPEAPMDGALYGRQTGTWEAIPDSVTGLGNLEGEGFVYRGLTSEGVVVWSTDKTTDELPEGVTNLYFTDERAFNAVAATFVDTASVIWDIDYDLFTIEANVVFPPSPPSSGCCEILVSDTHSAPPVMLTNEAETDFVYSG